MNRTAIRILTVSLTLSLGLAALTLAQVEGPGGRRVLASKDQTRAFIEQFFDVLINRRAFEAFEMIRSANPDAEQEIRSTLTATEDLLNEVRPVYGRVVSAELLDTKSLGQAFVRYDYLLKFERNALHCRVIFYCPTVNGVWIPINFTLNEELGDLFDDLGK